ncbi:MAG: ATP-binding protein, partial [Pseudomonadota bacterium]
NASKTRFLAAASHDLLQPLNAARLFVGAIDPEKPDANLLSKADQSIAAADQLLKGLLDISRLDHGDVRINSTSLPLGAIFADLVDEATPMAEAAGLSVRHVPTRLSVLADPDLLQSVLRNLMSNARRYTREGGVLIGARRSGGDHVRVEVWDAGPGIEPERQVAIFEAFQRDDAVDNLGARGAGLGLPVARRMARLMGTDIELRSVPGQGSVFSIRLPRVGRRTAPETLPAALKNPAIANLSGQTVWVIDDERDIRDAMSSLLTRWSASVSTYDGKSLPDLAAPKPDVVLVDHDLGQSMTGLDVIQQLRSKLPKTVRYALVSAVQDEVALERAAKMDVPLIAKPVDPIELADWLKSRETV